jgi:ABC-type branched-subunit amino acid transport system ATPase component
MNPILTLDKLCKKFGGVVAADNVTFSVQRASIHGLIGPNGAGKSTLLNLISGIYVADSGRIFFDGKDITKETAYNRSRMGIARTFQTPRFLHRSNLRDNLLLGADLGNHIGYLEGYLGKKSLNFEQELAELLEVAHISFDWDDDISGMPFGQRKLLEIVRSMIAHPKVMLVDEPAAGLNTKELEYAMALLNLAASQREIGIILIEHSMDMIMDICEDIVVLNFGAVIATGKPKEIASNRVVIEAYLGRQEDD